MSMFTIFDIAGSGMSAQSIRLNTIASNLANANNQASDPDSVYKARQPIFESVLAGLNPDQSGLGVRVTEIVESQVAPKAAYDPSNPLADKKGFVYHTNVNPIEEMANMISASRTFQNNIEVMNTTKQLLMATLRMGQ